MPPHILRACATTQTPYLRATFVTACHPGGGGGEGLGGGSAFFWATNDSYSHVGPMMTHAGPMMTHAGPMMTHVGLMLNDDQHAGPTSSQNGP